MWQEYKDVNRELIDGPALFSSADRASQLALQSGPVQSIQLRWSDNQRFPSLKNGTFLPVPSIYLFLSSSLLSQSAGQLCHPTAVSCAVGNRSYAPRQLDFQPTRMRQKKPNRLATCIKINSANPLAVRGNESAQLEISAEYPRCRQQSNGPIE
jgi:hypothetical protein